MLDAGADIIDGGGESTRPGFTPVNPDEEARRVLPVVRALAKEGAIVSIDTRHVAVAKAAVRCGASIVDPNKCIGCGLCTTKCAFDAIHLDRDRPECSTMVKYEQKLPSLGKYALKRAIKIKFGRK